MWADQGPQVQTTAHAIRVTLKGTAAVHYQCAHARLAPLTIQNMSTFVSEESKSACRVHFEGFEPPTSNLKASSLPLNQWCVDYRA